MKYDFDQTALKTTTNHDPVIGFKMTGVKTTSAIATECL